MYLTPLRFLLEAENSPEILELNANLEERIDTLIYFLTLSKVVKPIHQILGLGERFSAEHIQVCKIFSRHNFTNLQKIKVHVVFVNLWQNLCETMPWTARKYFFQKNPSSYIWPKLLNLQEIGFPKHRLEIQKFRSCVRRCFFSGRNICGCSRLMPSPSASSKFGSSILKFFKRAQFFMYTQNHFGILKS